MGLYDDVYNVACPTCGSGVGVRCTVQKGKHAGEKSTVPHSPRTKLARKIGPEHDALVKPRGARAVEQGEAILRSHEAYGKTTTAAATGPTFIVNDLSGYQERALEVAVKGAKETFTDRVSRQERIDVVMFGIHFARNIMQVPAIDIDQRLAEMIVDGGLDGSR